MDKKTQHQKAISRECSKFRILAIERILLAYKEISTRDIMKILYMRWGIQCDRKTIYQDMAAINRFIPLDVACGRHGKWKIVDIMEDLE